MLLYVCHGVTSLSRSCICKRATSMQLSSFVQRREVIYIPTSLSRMVKVFTDLSCQQLQQQQKQQSTFEVAEMQENFFDQRHDEKKKNHLSIPKSVCWKTTRGRRLFSLKLILRCLQRLYVHRVTGRRTKLLCRTLSECIYAKGNPILDTHKSVEKSSLFGSSARRRA